MSLNGVGNGIRPLQLWMIAFFFLVMEYHDWIGVISYRNSPQQGMGTAKSLRTNSDAANGDGNIQENNHKSDTLHPESVNFRQTKNQPEGEDRHVQEYDNKNETFCVGWDTDMDEWWTHHPEWTVSLENETHYCFSPIQEKGKAKFFRELYNAQYNSDCSNAITVEMQSAGWGADFIELNKALLYAYENQQPIQVHARKGRWHYAAKKDASKAVCPKKDMFCYFLDLSSCKADPDNLEQLKPKGDPSASSRKGRWVYEYATRPQTWLRREIYKLSSSTKLVAPCTVMHVRRTDVVLAGKDSRKYHAIQEYVDAAGEDLTENIFLLTDDQNAIEEATSQYPEYNWMYMDRPRFRGAEGGWEAQIPSDDPKFEVIVILSTLQLVENCETFVYGRSRFASRIREKMRKAKHIYLDEGKEVFNEENARSVNLSQHVV